MQTADLTHTGDSRASQAISDPAGDWQVGNVDGLDFGATAKSSRPSPSFVQSLLGSLWNDTRARVLTLFSAFLLVGVLMLSCFVVSLVLVTGGGAGGTSMKAIFGGATPEPTALPITQTLKGPAVNGTPIAPVLPSHLIIGSDVLSIVPVRMTDKGEWPDYDRGADKTVYWAGGTVVNYVFGLPPTEGNKAIFDALSAKAPLSVETSAGALKYRVGQLTTLKPGESAPFEDQSRPMVTLVLLGETGEEQRAVIAPYTDEAASNQPTVLGVPVDLGEVRVTALGQRVIPGTAVGLPIGKHYYQVDFEITSLMPGLLDASQFYSVFDDQHGNRLVVSPKASSSGGGKGWAQGGLQPGGTITVTAGFEISETVSGPGVMVSFAIDKSKTALATIALPYQPPSILPTATPIPERRVDVSLLSVSIAPEGNALRIVGTAHNLTDKVIPVQLVSMELSASNGMLLPLNKTVPPLEWSIAPDETLPFQVEFGLPPSGSSAYFSLLGETFEIPGIP